MNPASRLNLQAVPDGWFVAIMAGIVLALSGCGSSGHSYPENMSRLIVADSPRLYWLDNDRVFVPGYAPDDKLYGEDGNPKKGLYLLDTRTNTYVRHADLGYYSHFCYYQGFITYTVSGKMNDPVETNRQMEGMFGQEKPLPLGAKFNADLGNRGSYTDCPRVDREKRLRPEHTDLDKKELWVLATFLKEEDGYIYSSHCSEPYCGGRGGPDKKGFDDPAKLYRPDRQDPVELPLLAKEVSRRSYIRYSEWANKYIIMPGVRRDVSFQNYESALSGKAPFRIYLMTPKGDVEAIPLRDGDWLPPKNIALTRVGLFILGNAGAAQGEGGWLLKTDGRRVQLFEHDAPSSGLSPDGCKLAYATYHNSKSSDDGFLRVIDFCVN